MIQIPNFRKLREQLVSDPLLLKEMCIKLNIIKSDEGNKNPQRVLDAWKSSGFSVTVEVDDDELTEEERKAHYGDLADKCIKALKAKAQGGLKRG